MAAVLDALASYLQNMLLEMGKEEVHMLLGLSGEIDKMGIKVGDLKNFLADADRRNITDQSVQAWVRELRDIMYDATDILDLCQLKAMEQGTSRDMGCFNPLLLCLRNPLHAHDIASRIKNLNQRLDDIKARSTSFNFTNLGSYEDRGRKVASSRSSTRETSGGLDESSLVGEKIEEHTRNLVEMLTKEEETSQEYYKIMVFAIVGVGGIGKTTLAQKIFNKDIIQQEFMKKIWLSVNQNFNEVEILRRAITEAGGNHHSAGNTKATLEQTLKEALKGHKTLLVMDDVWDNYAWEGVLKGPLSSVVARGSRVLITTRHDTVARGMKAVEPYQHVDKLEPEEAWLLLKKQVVGNETEEPQVQMLKDIGMKIIEKCACLPLAVKVMGGLLRQKMIRRNVWENVLHDYILSVSHMPEELNYAMYLSYEDLHPCLKPCFLYYSLLPKSDMLFVDAVVGMWISEGFVHGNSHDLEELGREYHDELIQRNLIEPDINSRHICNMHDVVRSFGQYVARDEALIAHSSEIDITGKLHSQKFIRLSLEIKGSKSNELEWSSIQAQRSLRTLISVGHIKIRHGNSLLSFSSVRTLHIEYANFDELTESLDQLKHLRYLSITGTNTSRLPEKIVKMKLLQCINISYCRSLVKLPAGIGRLLQLRFLGLNGTGINDMPKGFSGLTNLRKLYGFQAHMDGDWCSLEELGPLSQLIDLQISGLENVSSSTYATKARIGEKVRLSYLILNCISRIGDDGRLVKEEESIHEKEHQQIEEVFDELCPPPCLEILGINGYFGRRLPQWMVSAEVVPFWSLRILSMDDLICCTELPNGLCQLPCLEDLKIIRAPAIKHVGPDFLKSNNHCFNHSQVGVPFPRLHELTFNGMVNWEEWEWEEQVKAMPILENLTLQKCKLRQVPPGLAFHTKALKKLSIYGVMQLRSLANFISVVYLDVFGNTDLERISNLPKLQKLVIINCPKMKLLEGMSALQRLNLVDFDMETVPRYVQNVNPRHLLVDCSLSLLTCIAAGKSGPEWDKFSHIQQVKAYAGHNGQLHDRISGDKGLVVRREWHVLYARDPFRFETNISRSAVAQACWERTLLAYLKRCPLEAEWPVGRYTYADKREPLCLRFRCNAHRHLFRWLRQACLHCNEVAGIASLSDQWINSPEYSAGLVCLTKYGRLQQQKESTGV